MDEVVSMSFWQKFKEGFRRFMAGRYGADSLSQAIIIAGLVLFLLAAFTRFGLFSILAMALYIWAIFRMYSRNGEKRSQENARYMAATRKLRTSVNQARTRLKNRKKYRYFRCPNCHARLRLPRGVGEVTVNCGQCKHSFRKKA
ncbi:MAG TPA: hypothetical protein IAA84_09775 [Candidatus Alectryocaccomicrobium excrementavium]|uniref:Zn-finger containing protein n=1 Tax=Candidatus Alectryocaccomicrobium excrementavium TaxID=2840668 RepID=A0A9D1G117_9FIRM|nr:hypothetical protein [Candidatus Alectryocaccomicrobium excrementavium]